MSYKIDLHFITNGPDHQTNFDTQLLKLIFKADLKNRARLANSFPVAVKMVEHFQQTGEILPLENEA